MLNCAVTLGFAVARWLEKLRLCDKSQVQRRFWRKCVRVEVVKIIPNARKSYNFGCLGESDESHFSWQAQHIVDLKVEKGDFAAQAQGFVNVTRLRLSYIGICSFRVVLVEPRYIGICDADCLLRSSLLREVSCKTLILEAWIVKLGLSLLVKVSWKMLAWIATFGESLVENASLDCHCW